MADQALETGEVVAGRQRQPGELVECIVLGLLRQLGPLGDALEVLLAVADAFLLGLHHPRRGGGDLGVQGGQDAAEVGGMLVEPFMVEPAGEPFEVVGAVLFELTGDAAAGQAGDGALMGSQVLDGGLQAVALVVTERLGDRLRPFQTVVQCRFLAAQVFRRVRGVVEQQVRDLLGQGAHPFGPGQFKAREPLGQGGKFLLELWEMLHRSLADVLLQRDHGVADQVGQALRGPCQDLHRRLVLAQGDTDGLEGVVGLEGVDGLLAGHGDLASGDLQLDVGADEQGRDQVAQGVLGPAEGGAAEVLQQAFAVHGAVAVDVVADADERLVVDADARVAAGDLDQAEGVELGRHGLEVARPGAQELLRHGGIDPLRRFGVAVKDLQGGGA